jgi:hypothetical protein
MTSPHAQPDSTLLDIYLALSHIGAPVSGPLAPLAGEAHEETPRLYVAHIAGDEWRVFLRSDLPERTRESLAALAPQTLLTDAARVLSILDERPRERIGDEAVRAGVWRGHTLLFPDDLALPRRSDLQLARLPSGVDLYGLPVPDAMRLRPALAPADEEPPAREVFPAEQFAVVADGVVVSTCESSRESALAAEAWVRTVPSATRRGYAASVTAAWALDVRRRSKVPFYSHARSNAASAGVARTLRLLPFLEDAGYL